VVFFTAFAEACLLQVLQNVNSAAHAAQRPCLMNCDLLSCARG
jgi:hypothetical protein